MDKKLRYTHISRSMSEINEEVKRVCEADCIGLTEATLICFCDWLCGLTDISLSQSVGLAKFAAESLQKGVPVEDVGEFVGQKLRNMVTEEMIKKGSGSSGYNN